MKKFDVNEFANDYHIDLFPIAQILRLPKLLSFQPEL